MFKQGISKTTHNALAVLGQIDKVKQFYLAGGTAAALRMGHRLSFDLDFFTPLFFDPHKLSQTIAKRGNFSASQILPDTLLGMFLDCKVSFFQYQYPLIRKTEPFAQVEVAALPDIAAMKIDAIADRGLKRDFVDLFFIAKQFSLDKILRFYDQKYHRLEVNQFHLIKSLGYFFEADNSDMPQMIEKISWEKVKRFFESEAIRLGRRYL